jgi:hypothetical protein
MVSYGGSSFPASTPRLARFSLECPTCRLTSPSSGQSKASHAVFRLPLMSDVRPVTAFGRRIERGDRPVVTCCGPSMARNPCFLCSFWGCVGAFHDATQRCNLLSHLPRSWRPAREAESFRQARIAAVGAADLQRQVYAAGCTGNPKIRATPLARFSA